MAIDVVFTNENRGTPNVGADVFIEAKEVYFNGASLVLNGDTGKHHVSVAMKDFVAAMDEVAKMVPKPLYVDLRGLQQKRLQELKQG